MLSLICQGIGKILLLLFATHLFYIIHFVHQLAEHELDVVYFIHHGVHPAMEARIVAPTMAVPASVSVSLWRPGSGS